MVPPKTSLGGWRECLIPFQSPSDVVEGIGFYPSNHVVAKVPVFHFFEVKSNSTIFLLKIPLFSEKCDFCYEMLIKHCYSYRIFLYFSSSGSCSGVPTTKKHSAVVKFLLHFQLHCATLKCSCFTFG